MHSKLRQFKRFCIIYSYKPQHRSLFSKIRRCKKHRNKDLILSVLELQNKKYGNKSFGKSPTDDYCPFLFLRIFICFTYSILKIFSDDSLFDNSIKLIPATSIAPIGNNIFSCCRHYHIIKIQ